MNEYDVSFMMHSTCYVFLLEILHIFSEVLNKDYKIEINMK